MLKIALCDDEIRFRTLLREKISIYMKGRMLDSELYEYSFKNPDNNGADFFSCDVYLISSGGDGSDGFLLANRIRLMKPDATIVLLATDDACAWCGYKIGAACCVRHENLLKEEYFYECMDVIFAEFQKEAAISMHFLGGRKTFLPGKLIYVESRLHKLHFFISENKINEYTMYGRLEKIEHELVYPFFVRTHQSFLVNLKFVKSMEKGYMHLMNDLRIGISRARVQQVRRQYLDYKEYERNKMSKV